MFVLGRFYRGIVTYTITVKGADSVMTSGIFRILIALIPYLKSLIFKDQSISGTLKANRGFVVVLVCFLLVLMALFTASSLLTDEKSRSLGLESKLETQHCDAIPAPYDKTSVLKILDSEHL